MRQWIAGLWVVGAAGAGLAAGCASSSGNPLFILDGGSDATQVGADATSDDSSSACGGSGQECCTGDTCNLGRLTCSGGTCVDLGNDGGGGGSDTGSGGDDSGSDKDTGGGGDDSGHAKDSETQETGSGDGGEAGAADCGSAPKLFKEDGGRVYCGYDAGSIYCGVGTECCVGGNLGGSSYAADECGKFGKACTNGETYDAGGSPGLPVECAQIADCTANGVKAVACCLQGGTVSEACTYPKASGGTGIVCETGSGSGPTKCKTGETNVCSSQADCPTGTTCTAGKWKILDLGFCL